jgi:signal peptidase I
MKMRRSIARGGGVVAWILACGVALLLLATFVPTFFGLESLIVASGSMTPVMPVGAVAMTREVDAHAITAGDIISFRRPGSPETTTHRVVAVKAEGAQMIFTTKGDANATPDPTPVVIDGRVHKVDYIVPDAGYVVRYARSPVGALVLFVIPIAGLVFERRAHRRRKAKAASAEDLGWSATTLSLLRLMRDPLGSTPAG